MVDPLAHRVAARYLKGAAAYQPLPPQAKVQIETLAKQIQVGVHNFNFEATKLGEQVDGIWKVLDRYYRTIGQDSPPALREFALWSRSLKNHVLDKELFDVWKLMHAALDLSRSL